MDIKAIEDWFKYTDWIRIFNGDDILFQAGEWYLKDYCWKNVEDMEADIQACFEAAKTIPKDTLTACVDINGKKWVPCTLYGIKEPHIIIKSILFIDFGTHCMIVRVRDKRSAIQFARDFLKHIYYVFEHFSIKPSYCFGTDHFSFELGMISKSPILV
jgi:hypothetical protein